MIVYTSANIRVVHRFSAPVELVRDPVGGVAIEKCYAGIAGQALKERGVWVPYPDRKLISCVHLRRAEKGQVGLTVAIDARGYHGASVLERPGKTVPYFVA